jgi:hypothetical protein
VNWLGLLEALGVNAGLSLVERLFGRGRSVGYDVPGPQVSDTGYEITDYPQEGPPVGALPSLDQPPPPQALPVPVPQAPPTFPYAPPGYEIPATPDVVQSSPPATGGQIGTTLLAAGMAYGRKTTAALERQLLNRYIKGLFRGGRRGVRLSREGAGVYRYVLPAFAQLGRGAVAIGGSLFPSRIGYPGATDFEREFGRPGSYVLEEMQMATQRTPALDPLEEFDVVRLPAPLPREPTSFGRRVIDAGGQYGNEWLRGELERLGVILPAGGGVYAPLGEITPRVGPLPQVEVRSRLTGGRIAPTGSTGGSQTTTPAPRRTGPLGRINQQTLNRALLAGSAIGLLQTLRRRSGSGAVPAAQTTALNVPGDEISPGPLPGLPPGVSPLPTLGSSPLPIVLSSGYFSSSSSGRCSCETRKRRRMRECKERANVKWAGGRKKGKLAGTKCVVWKN